MAERAKGFGEDTVLYFAYAALIAPDQMADVAPGAVFEFIAHLPDWGLSFEIVGNGWEGGLPTAVLAPGSTVWGAVYSVAREELPGIDLVESGEGRIPVDIDAVDSVGKRQNVITHVADESGLPSLAPSHEYVELMVHGSRHWGLPVGWVIGLQDHLNEWV
jgi:gamma-glutamylcyclotransferase (GGCT)/AIG2-like uncharacterized protein YtfP